MDKIDSSRGKYVFLILGRSVHLITITSIYTQGIVDERVYTGEYLERAWMKVIEADRNSLPDTACVLTHRSQRYWRKT